MRGAAARARPGGVMFLRSTALSSVALGLLLLAATRGRAQDREPDPCEEHAPVEREGRRARDEISAVRVVARLFIRLESDKRLDLVLG